MTRYVIQTGLDIKEQREKLTNTIVIPFEESRYKTDKHLVFYTKEIHELKKLLKAH